MTHREHDNGFETVPQQRAAHDQGWQGVLTLLIDHGFEGLANAMQILLNEAMKLKTRGGGGGACYQRTATRRGYANGFKAKTVETRLGRLAALRAWQARGVQNSTRRHWNAGTRAAETRL